MTFLSWIAAIITGLVLIYVTPANASCEGTFESEGCYQAITGEFQMLLNDRNNIVWDNYPPFLASLICKCAKLAKAAGYMKFGIQFYGECWGSNKSIATLTPVGTIDACVGSDYKACTCDSGICTGQRTSIKVYSLLAEMKQTFAPIDGAYGEWSGWTRCSTSCGNGEQTKERSCDQPLPQFGGRTCSALGPSTETTKCSVRDCLLSYPFESYGCSVAIKGDLFDSFESRLTRDKGLFCRAVYTFPQPSLPDFYKMSASLFSRFGPEGVLDGNSGFIYNAVDVMNFQYIYFMFGSASSNCYTTGTVRQGMDDFFGSQRKLCPPLELYGNQIITVEIAVTMTEARLEVNGIALDRVPNTLPWNPKGGALLRNGERNKIYFRDIIFS